MYAHVRDMVTGVRTVMAVCDMYASVRDMVTGVGTVVAVCYMYASVRDGQPMHKHPGDIAGRLFVVWYSW